MNYGYAQADLLEALNEDLIFAVFSFNYNQKGATYEFKRTFIKFFDEDEFMLWKIKANLTDLITGKETRDRILNEFYFELGYGDYPFLQRIGYYVFELEDAEYAMRSFSDVLKDLQADARELLAEIVRQEQATPGFKIKSFKPIALKPSLTPVITKKVWWKFWD